MSPQRDRHQAGAGIGVLAGRREQARRGGAGHRSHLPTRPRGQAAGRGLDPPRNSRPARAGEGNGGGRGCGWFGPAAPAKLPRAGVRLMVHASTEPHSPPPPPRPGWCRPPSLARTRRAAPTAPPRGAGGGAPHSQQPTLPGRGLGGGGAPAPPRGGCPGPAGEAGTYPSMAQTGGSLEGRGGGGRDGAAQRLRKRRTARDG